MGTVLFVYAHPDDESFGIAGTAMKPAAAGSFHLAVDRAGAPPAANDDLLGDLG